MGDYNALRSQDIMTTSIYNFLDNLLAAVRTSETLASEAHERDQINVSNDIKPGGYSEDIFIFLSEREKEEYICCVCYSVIKDAHQCSNGHKYCYSCIYVWSTCNRAGADCCPACRCDGIYARNEQLNEKIGGKRVKCQDEGCNWRGFLRDYGEHEHRHYEFKELSRSIELPTLKVNENASVVTPLATIVQNSQDVGKETGVNPIGHCEPTGHSHGPTSAESGAVNTNRASVTRTNVAPRRLTRLPEAVTNNNTGRSIGTRANVANYSRASNMSTRCPTYRAGVTYPPRPPRIARINRSSDQEESRLSTDSNGRGSRLNQHESTQTYGTESAEDGSHTPILSLLLDSSRDAANQQPPPRHASAVRDSRSPLFPSINTRNHLGGTTAADRQHMEYRRLAPTYASRRNQTLFPNDGREHLAMMLILLTSDLEDRITVRNSSRDPVANNNNSINNNSPNRRSSSLTTMSSSLATDSSMSDDFVLSSNQNRPVVAIPRAVDSSNSQRLQEFRNLNRRLSEVANSLDILIESTSRQGDRLAASATLSSSDTSTASDNLSDTDE